jgi:hypothetical protein
MVERIMGKKPGKKNPAAVALGKLRAAQVTNEERRAMAPAGGAARAAALTPEERSAIASAAAKARWAKKKTSAKKARGK